MDWTRSELLVGPVVIYNMAHPQAGALQYLVNPVGKTEWKRIANRPTSKGGLTFITLYFKGGPSTGFRGSGNLPKGRQSGRQSGIEVGQDRVNIGNTRCFRVQLCKIAYQNTCTYGNVMMTANLPMTIWTNYWRYRLHYGPKMEILTFGKTFGLWSLM